MTYLIPMRRFLCIDAAILVAATFLSPSDVSAKPRPLPHDTITYTLTPVFSGRTLEAVDVEIRLKAGPGGETDFDLPAHWAGQRQLWRNLKDLVVEGGARLESFTPAKIRIAAPAGAPLTLRYRITSPLKIDPTVDDQLPYQPWLRPGWFMLSGESTLAAPTDRPTATARFVWKGPAGFGFASDLENLPPTNNLRQVQKSTLIGGWDLRITRQGTTRLATLGPFSFKEAKLISDLQRLLVTERRFWRDPPNTPYLVTVAPVTAPRGSTAITGESKDDAFAVTATRDTPLEQVTGLLAHEIFHNWNPSRLGGDPPATGVKQTFRDAWFVEGFTDFYARRLALLSGLHDRAEFVAGWNQALLAYATSPVRDRASADLEDKAQDPDVERLPYYQGAMLAAIWDRRLRQRSNGRISLDDVLRAQEKAARRIANSQGAAALFRKTAEGFGLDVGGDLRRFVEKGAQLSLPEDAFGRCFKIIRVSQPVFDRGFDRDATVAAGMIVTDLDSDSAAARAGMTNGMKLRRLISGSAGDATVDYVWEVETPDGGVRIIRYKPEGRGMISVQKVEQATAAPKSCQAPHAPANTPALANRGG